MKSSESKLRAMNGCDMIPNLLKTSIKRSARRIAPQWSEEMEVKLWLLKQARRLHRSAPPGQALEQTLDLALASKTFAPNQKRPEIFALLQRIASARATVACEIGGFKGGTLFLLSRVLGPQSRLLSIDLDYTSAQQRAYRSFRMKGQEINCLRANSHLSSTEAYVRQWCRGQKIDLLFIDGDHTYSGVERDFRMYAPLVRSGGLVAFHDIVPDSRTRGGSPTGNDVGEVPAFWKFIRAHYRTEELIENPDQDGYGIGVVHWDGQLSDIGGAL